MRYPLDYARRHVHGLWRGPGIHRQSARALLQWEDSTRMSQAFIQRLQTARPRLAAKARIQIDKVSGEPVLLYPEGVVLLNATAVAIISLCDGTRSFSEILSRLAEDYNVPTSELEADVSDYFFKLHQQSLGELAEDQ